MKWLIFSIMVIVLAGCTSPTGQPAVTPGTTTSKLADYGAAPELTNETWLNTTNPLRLAELHGKVILLDMWTFG
jgi:hypothetical protein